MKRNQWSAVFIAILLFSCGAAVGALSRRYYDTTVVNAAKTEDLRQHYLSEMRSRLGLTTTQVNQLETIMDDTKAKTKAVRDQYHPQMLKIRNEQISRVKSILTPKQVTVYEQLVAERERHAQEQEEHDRREEQKRAAMRKHIAAP